jgi:hypothetical protein
MAKGDFLSPKAIGNRIKVSAHASTRSFSGWKLYPVFLEMSCISKTELEKPADEKPLFSYTRRATANQA